VTLPTYLERNKISAKFQHSLKAIPTFSDMPDSPELVSDIKLIHQPIIGPTLSPAGRSSDRRSARVFVATVVGPKVGQTIASIIGPTVVHHDRPADRSEYVNEILSHRSMFTKENYHSDVTSSEGGDIARLTYQVCRPIGRPVVRTFDRLGPVIVITRPIWPSDYDHHCMAEFKWARR
jgi:hypothetical protein